jgi:predicted ATP-dependent serine protease
VSLAPTRGASGSKPGFATGSTLDLHPILRGMEPLLLEHQRELDRVGARLDAAQIGEGGLLVIEGSPGLGKSTLLRAAAVEARRRGFEVAWAPGAELAVRGCASAV